MGKAKDLKKKISEVYYKHEETTEIRLGDEEEIIIRLMDQHPERSYEDRNVFMELSMPNGHVVGLKPGDEPPEPVNYTAWIPGERAIAVGMMFIKRGERSLEHNRIHAYEVIELVAGREGALSGRYSRLLIKKVSNNRPVGYGDGFFYFDLTYIANEGELMSRHIPNVVIYWSQFIEEFTKQVDQHSGGIPVEWIDFDYQKDVVIPFQKLSMEMERQQADQSDNGEVEVPNKEGNENE